MLGIFYRILKALFGCFFGCFVIEVEAFVKGINIGFLFSCFTFSIKGYICCFCPKMMDFFNICCFKMDSR